MPNQYYQESLDETGHIKENWDQTNVAKLISIFLLSNFAVPLAEGDFITELAREVWRGPSLDDLQSQFAADDMDIWSSSMGCLMEAILLLSSIRLKFILSVKSHPDYEPLFSILDGSRFNSDLKVIRTVERVGPYSTVRKLLEQKPEPILHWTGTGFLMEIPGMLSNFYC